MASASASSPTSFSDDRIFDVGGENGEKLVIVVSVAYDGQTGDIEPYSLRVC